MTFFNACLVRFLSFNVSNHAYPIVRRPAKYQYSVSYLYSEHYVPRSK